MNSVVQGLEKALQSDNIEKVRAHAVRLERALTGTPPHML